MDSVALHDRTARLLESRLEEIALTLERSPARARQLERLVLQAEAATRNAVCLELLSAREAGEIWAAVASRHPAVRLLADGRPLAA